MTIADSVDRPTAPSRRVSKSRSTGNRGSINSRSLPPASRYLTSKIRFARGECRSRTDHRNDRAIRRNGVRCCRNDPTHVEADLVQRKLQAIELLRLGNEHVAGAGRVVPP